MSVVASFPVIPIERVTNLHAKSRGRNGPSNTIDLLLIFPPQWSPFQPFLSAPSLKAYLQSRGHRVQQKDWNVGFYNYFISVQRLPVALQRLMRYLRELGDEHAVYRARVVHALAVLQDYKALRRHVEELRDQAITGDLPRFKTAVESFQQLLNAFSVAEPVIEVGTSSLQSGSALSSVESLDAFSANVAENPFVSYFNTRVAELEAPRYFGISIIGQEQIGAGLTLCRQLKERFPNVPIIIGGSVFSRLVEKDQTIANLFGKYFDFVCRYEGEQPMDEFLSCNDPRIDRPPNLAFVENGTLVTTSLCEPLPMDELPTPDFDGIDFSEYLSPEIVLPLLTTRGCYWGKCAFCYHGMIYQDRYRMREPELIAADVDRLNKKYGVHHFAFNDEAIPPKLFRRLPAAIPAGRYYFTGLYKFEKYFRADDYEQMYGIGFRSLYIGLETASERVQAHMLKNNLQATMVANLQGAHDAGIWNHAFVFFGFPTETEAEANETIDFLVKHADIIHSEGTGTFSFEHNAPIHHDPARFGVMSVVKKPTGPLELYYDYQPSHGLDALQAAEMLERFTEVKRVRGLYQTGRWIPREYLLILLSHHTRESIRSTLGAIEGLQPTTRLRNMFACVTADSDVDHVQHHFVVNKHSHQVFETNEDTVTLLNFLDDEIDPQELVRNYPVLETLVGPASIRASA